MGRQIMERGRGVVVATGHIGNWEMLGRALAKAGYDVWSLAKAPFDGRVAAFLEAWRLRGGVRVANRGSTKTIKAVRDHLAKGGGLGALVDVDTPVKSTWVPFFGHLAKTPTAAADLALKFDATLLVMWGWRERFGFHSGAVLEIPLERTDDPVADVERLTRRITEELEAAIRRHPEQWIWTHRRFKSPPPAA
jgi:KDO2-lipid IV(A) lauroyltransferase